MKDPFNLKSTREEEERLFKQRQREAGSILSQIGKATTIAFQSRPKKMKCKVGR